MNALAHRAPRVASRRGRHALPTPPVLPRVHVPRPHLARPTRAGLARPAGVVGASLCCTAGLMCAVYLVASALAA
jgi:hypothetical protein